MTSQLPFASMHRTLIFSSILLIRSNSKSNFLSITTSRFYDRKKIECALHSKHEDLGVGCIVSKVRIILDIWLTLSVLWYIEVLLGSRFSVYEK